MGPSNAIGSRKCVKSMPAMMLSSERLLGYITDDGSQTAMVLSSEDTTKLTSASSRRSRLAEIEGNNKSELGKRVLLAEGERKLNSSRGKDSKEKRCCIMSTLRSCKIFGI